MYVFEIIRGREGSCITNARAGTTTKARALAYNITLAGTIQQLQTTSKMVLAVYSCLEATGFIVFMSCRIWTHALFVCFTY